MTKERGAATVPLYVKVIHDLLSLFSALDTLYIFLPEVREGFAARKASNWNHHLESPLNLGNGMPRPF